MIVPVMQIRVVWVGVAQRLMLVPMRVRFGHRAVMHVPMMLVVRVRVGVFVLELLMFVRVLVPLLQVQP